MVIVEAAATNCGITHKSEGQKPCHDERSCRFRCPETELLSDQALWISLSLRSLIRQRSLKINKESNKRAKPLNRRGCSNRWYLYTMDTFRCITLSFPANFCFTAVIGKGDNTAPG